MCITVGTRTSIQLATRWNKRRYNNMKQNDLGRALLPLEQNITCSVHNEQEAWVRFSESNIVQTEQAPDFQTPWIRITHPSSWFHYHFHVLTVNLITILVPSRKFHIFYSWKFYIILSKSSHLHLRQSKQKFTVALRSGIKIKIFTKKFDLSYDKREIVFLLHLQFCNRKIT